MSIRHRAVLLCRRMMGKKYRHVRIVRLLTVVTIGLGSLLYAPPLQANAASAVAASDPEIIHVVQAGENLASIAGQYGVELQALSAYNDIGDWNHIVIGQQITIPQPEPDVRQLPAANLTELPADGGYYTVRRGDLLSLIARDFGLTLNDILRLNGINNPNTITVGQQLRVTARVAPTKTSSETKLELADTVYVVQDGNALAQIARKHNTTVEQLMVLNGLPNENFVYIGQRLRLKEAPPASEIMGVAGAPEDGLRRIEVDLSEQTLTAWQGDVAVLETLVSTGKAATPTVTGRYAINVKYDSQHMTGDDYDLPGVPWVMYFWEDFAIHGAYWHSNFGQPTSHGCINVSLRDAEALYEWAPIGTEVWVHE